MPPAPPAPPPPRPPAGPRQAYRQTNRQTIRQSTRAPRQGTRHKSVTFCSHCKYDKRPGPLPDGDVRYYSDPGRPDAPKQKMKKKPKETKYDPTEADVRYYSEPDAKYFEIDYVFLKELRKIARNNCPKCKRRRSRRNDNRYRDGRSRGARGGENYVMCEGRYHDAMEHCRLCCKICSRSAIAPESPDEYSLASRSYSLPRPARRRHDSPQSNKSVSFLDSSNDESPKDEPNYTATSFTNDLKKFLLKPSSPRLSLREKFIISFKQELEATKRSPKLRAIKGLWKSY